MNSSDRWQALSLAFSTSLGAPIQFAQPDGRTRPRIFLREAGETAHLSRPPLVACYCLQASGNRMQAR